MTTDERTFTLRFSLSASIPPELLDDDAFDENAWIDEWEATIKPGLVRAVFAHLRSFAGWSAHVRNRGAPETDEIEIVAVRRYGGPGTNGG